MEVAQHFLRRGTPCLVTLLDCSKAFDMVKFSTLFKKLAVVGVPPIIVRVLAFVYEEQFAWVKWGRSKSKQFSIVNGTRQGSVLSPSLFSLYMDELLGELRRLGVGCHISGVFFGAALYADDLVLISPSRNAMQKMLSVCERYAEDQNLVFSTDPNPELSKTKCLYMVGKVRGRQVQYPKPVRLSGAELPWVKHANHLGHTLHEDCTMEEDARSKRMAFISDSLDIRDMFAWAHPMQVLQATQVYSTSFYGSMLWDLYGEEANKVYRCWNTAAKLTWDVPRNTFTFLVDKVLTGDMSSVREGLLTRYAMYLQGLFKSKTKEMRVLANVACNDVRCTTGRNYSNLSRETGLDLRTGHKLSIKKAISQSNASAEEEWRVPLLARLLGERREYRQADKKTEQMDRLIDEVCSSTFE